MQEESAIIKTLRKVLESGDDKNYDPRMEELMRSDKLIDPKAENLSKLQDQEIYHIAKLRGMQVGLKLTVMQCRKAYDLPWMKDYHTPYIDYIRSLDPEKAEDKKELEKELGGMPMVSEMISQLIYLNGAEEAWKAKLYADSIKPIAGNQPMMFPQYQEEKEGTLSKIIGWIFGRSKSGDQNTGGYRR